MVCSTLVALVPSCLSSDDQAVAEGSNDEEEGGRLGRHLLAQDDGAALVEDAQVHCSGVQIDAAVESVRLVVKTHHGLLWHGSGSLSPHRGWKDTSLPENPTRSFGIKTRWSVNTI